MAAQTSKHSVIKCTADGDTFSGPCRIAGLKAATGSNANVITFKDSNNVQLWIKNLAANSDSPTEIFDTPGFRLDSGTYTCNMTATGGTLYIYLA